MLKMYQFVANVAWLVLVGFFSMCLGYHDYCSTNVPYQSTIKSNAAGMLKLF